MSESRCGFVALVGRPNVGKSTLLNHILGQKISITSRRPQTTRHRIVGIKTSADTQAIYVDTPGIHQQEERAINRYMNRTAAAALHDVDVVVMVLEGTRWTAEDDKVLSLVKACGRPVIAALNKVDLVVDKPALLPYLAELQQKMAFADIVPVSALRGYQLEQLEQVIARHLPEGRHFFPDDQVTDRSLRFLAAELVREKVMRQLGDEVPYSVAVEIEQFAEDNGVTHIAALILVEKEGQKAIVIGKGGERLKSLGQQARVDMERLLGNKVMLKLWVKVKRGWADDERALHSLGYRDDR